MSIRAMRRSRASAFTLIEVIVVMLILAMLVTLAVTNRQMLAGWTRRAEARMALSAISRAELVARFDSHAWACTFDELGFALDGATRESPTRLRTAIYTYQLACDANGFYATATGNVDGDGWLDVAVSTPSARFAMLYDDVTDSHDASAGQPPAGSPATPAPAATPPPANNGNGSSGNGGNGNNGNGNDGNNDPSTAPTPAPAPSATPPPSNGNGGNNGNGNGRR